MDKYTSIRLLKKTKDKMEILKGSFSYNSYLEMVNDIVAKQKVNIKTGDDLPKIFKGGTERIIKILRAFEKQYFGKTMNYSEQTLAKLYDDAELNSDDNTSSQGSESTQELHEKIRLLEAKQVQNNTNIDPYIIKDCIAKIDDIKTFGFSKKGLEDGEIAYRKQELDMSLDIIKMKLSKLQP